ncbi:MAG TPA: pyridoxamine 5'-phosphate oxidase family protein [Candidatus Binatia bacterium]|nr:pyridoxamine 5'-phosphate oxidase family protein [Candidatus Binatia bacterium]
MRVFHRPTAAASARVRVRRHADRARYDTETIREILDGALICHIGVIVDGAPVVLPTGFGRIGDTLYLHGATSNSHLAAALHGVCITATHVDGLVLARSASGHSMNFRSAVVMGRGRPVTDPAEKRAALRAVVEHAIPGRWTETRQPSDQEIEGTAVVAVELTEASAKVRTGPPMDSASDQALPWWAGEVPLRLVAGAPLEDPQLAAGIPEPDSVAAFRRRFAAADGAGDAARSPRSGE